MKFKDFFLEQTKNPLRKQALRDSGRMSNLDYVQQQKKKLSGSDYKKIRKLKEVGEDEFADKFKQQKIASREKTLSRDYLTGGFDKTKFTKVGDVDGFEFYVRNDDEKLNNPAIVKLLKGRLSYSIKKFANLAKGVVPIKGKPKFIIEDTSKHFERARGYMLGNRIHLDWDYVSDPKTILHEYAHYLVSNISDSEMDVIRNEYKKLLDNYFRSVKKKMRGNLEDVTENELLHLRRKIAKRIGLPDPYGVTNPDEFLAVMIENWKDLPNNPQTYKLKTIIKRIISRI